MAAERGPIAYLDQFLGTYRMHGSGMWTGRTHEQQLRSEIDFLQQVDVFTSRRHHRHVRSALARWRYHLMYHHRQSGRQIAARWMALAALWTDAPGEHIPRQRLLKMLLDWRRRPAATPSHGGAL